MFMLGFLVSLSLHASPAADVDGSPAAQAVADADLLWEHVLGRRAEDIPATKQAADQAATTWLRQKVAELSTLPPERRIGRRAQLLAQAHRRALTELEVELLEAQRGDVALALAPAEALAKQGELLRAVALARGVVEAAGPYPELAKLGAPLEDQAKASLETSLAKATGPAEQALWRYAKALLEGTTSAPAEPELARRLKPDGAPVVDAKACPDGQPTFTPAPGVPGHATLSLGPCPVTRHESEETVQVTSTKTVMVDRQKEVTTTERQFANGWVEQTNCRQNTDARARYGSGTVCDEVQHQGGMKDVEVTRLETVQVPEQRQVTEGVLATVRDYETAVEARVRVDGDGQKLESTKTVRTSRREERYRATEGGKGSSFSDDGEKAVRAQLAQEVTTLVEAAVSEWNALRGQALLGRAVAAQDLEGVALAVRLLKRAPSEAADLVTKRVGLTTGQVQDFATGTIAPLVTRLPPEPALRLPPPSAEAVREAGRGVVKDRFAVLAPAVVSQNPMVGSGKGTAGLGLTLGAGLTPFTRPDELWFSRAALDVFLGGLGYWNLDVTPRLELGIALGPLLQLTALALVDLELYFGDAPTNAGTTRPPTFLAFGYGGRASVRLESVGLELMLARTHRTWAEAPVGVRIDARLAYFWSDDLQLFFGVRIRTNGDLGAPSAVDRPESSQCLGAQLAF